jgi:DNA segregation ATPase FtsK/SpoIIIE, S-DNA-T family
MGRDPYRRYSRRVRRAFRKGQPGYPVMVFGPEESVGMLAAAAGSGKSGVLNAILAILTACKDVVIWGVDLKGGMEIGPWAECLGRPLATTPEQATALFRDAVNLVDERAADQAAQGSRLWEPAPDDPAVFIVVDEYAEMPAEAQEYSDSVARRGRATAVNLNRSGGLRSGC